MAITADPPRQYATERFPFDLSSPEFWLQGPAGRLDAYAALRAHPTLTFWPENGWLVADESRRGDGYFAVVKFEDILYMSKNPELFSSVPGITVANSNPDVNEFFGSMIVMDDPRHARLRKVVAAGFTPRMLKKLEDSVQLASAAIVDTVESLAECDFVTDIAAALPLKIICDMMNIDKSHYQFVFDRTNTIIAASDPEYVPEGVDPNMAVFLAAKDLMGLITELAQSRVGGDGDDLTTMLVNSEIDGERLTFQEIASFFILLVVAGNETTRNAISHGLVLLRDNPDQRQIWLNDFEAVAPTAVDEIVRWASPVTYMRRTATRDTQLRGTPIKAGDKLCMFYAAANHDEDQFVDARRFDVRRPNTHHVGFGGPGPHFCLGAHLARREITVMFRELFRRLPDIDAVGAPDYLRSQFIHGVKHLRCEFTPVG